MENDACESLSTRRAAEWLARGGLRPSRQRLALARLLVGDGMHRHVSADELWSMATAAGQDVSLATVYNALHHFCAAGLMTEIALEGARSYFDTRVDSHAHYFFEDSATLVDSPPEAVKPLQLGAPPDGTVVTRVDVIIRLKGRS